MRQLWTRREIHVPAKALWSLLVDPSTWPAWGPSVRAVTLNDRELRVGTVGTVCTVVSLELPFEITAFEPGARWAWNVAGLPATDHIVESLGPNRCRASFGVPWPTAPYLAVCRQALSRLDALVTESSLALPIDEGVPS
jgi:hypothetical protein